MLLRFVLFIVISVLVVVVGTLVAYAKLQAQGRAARAFAAAHGWSYRAKDDVLAGQLVGSPFGVGVNRKVISVMEGSYRTAPVRVFGYSYRDDTSNGVGRPQRLGYEFHGYLVVNLLAPFPLPSVQVTPVGFDMHWNTPPRRPGLVTGNAQFDQAFEVASPGPQAATAYVGPRLQQWLLNARGGPFRLSGNEVTAWWPGDMPLQMIEPMLDYCLGLIAEVGSAGTPGQPSAVAYPNN